MLIWQGGEWLHDGVLCSFGITEAIGAFLASTFAVDAGAAAAAGGLTATDAAAVGGLTAADAAGISGGAGLVADAGAAAGAGGAVGAGLGAAGTAADVAAAAAGGADAAAGLAGVGDVLGGGTPSAALAGPTSSLPDLGAAATPSIAPAVGTAAPGVGGGAAAISAPASAGLPGDALLSTTSTPFATGAPLGTTSTTIGGAPFGDAGAFNTGTLADSVGSGAGLTNPNAIDASAAGGSSSGGGAFSGTTIGNAVDNPTLGTIGKALGANAPTLLAAGGLGLDLFQSGQKLPGQSALNTEASQLAAQGQTLQSYLQTGTLPPGVQASITQAADSAKAAIRSKYAQLGGDTSAMEQDLAAVDQNAATSGVAIAQQLLTQGVSETQLSSELYGNLLNVATTQNANLSSAIGNFAKAAAGTPTILQLGTVG